MTTVTHLTHLPASAHGLALSELKARKIVHIAMGDREMDALATQLEFFSPKTKILTFPAWDTMPYDRTSPKASIMAERLATLGQLAAEDGDYILITTVAAVLQKLPPKTATLKLGVNVKRGQIISQSQLIEALVAQGYQRVGKAMEAGEFSVRGSLLDVVPAGAQEGVRIDWFGDEVEKLKHFDVLTQISSGETEHFALYPTSEAMLSEQTITQFRTRYRELFGTIQKSDALYEAISAGSYFPGMEHWLPLFYPKLETLCDYTGDALITFDDEVAQAIAEREETIQDYYQARIEGTNARKKSSFGEDSPYFPVPPEMGFIVASEWEELLRVTPHAVFSGFAKDSNATDLGIHKVMPFIQGDADNSPFQQLKGQLESAAISKKNVVIACYTNGSRDRLFGLLMERGIHTVMCESWLEAQKIKGKTVGLVILALEHGFETPNLLLLGEQDVLGERIVRKSRKKKTAELFLAEAANFNEGDIVVHREHGIARFEGLIAVEVQGAKHDCLKLIYDGDDKLFLPVENIELITRFGLEEDNVKLDKLGGASWQARKAKLKQRITIAAEALLKTAAERLVKTAPVIEVQTGSYDEFCARFGYAETDDQARAISEVAEDLHAGKPMDRLVCGDVGFGKTEVALRAAFIAAKSENKIQVAVIVPTTLLARQHFKNFKERFAGFGVEVRQLSRMVPAKAQKETREQLEKGEVDIVVGTHALLANGVKFKNLGLLIVDEEQHFGVAQKEKLKSVKSDVHVLTLSATPIPRTMQMALTGVRDLSLITTPPVDRLAIRSFVMPFDPVSIREAVMRELHRGGRCFVVTPRIKDIADLKHKLLELVPEAKLAVAHGQMSPASLDKVMNDFYDGTYNVLLSTAIIESGLDIPTANTMIIHNAHLFGLSQLYQMRGRVGRGKTRAYAYFMLPHRREITKGATRRLEVMQTLDTLGAGFTLANHDMDIRGFGNLVGEEQSGHIREVGIELYQQMLEEAVAALRQRDEGYRMKDEGEKDASSSFILHPSSDFTPQINLGLSVMIPEHYVNDLPLRMGLYRRAADMREEGEIESFAAELIDRFGPMPEETRHLVDILGLKMACKKASIERLDVGPKGAVISFYQNSFSHPDALIAFVERRITTLKIRPDQKLVFSKEWKSDVEKISTLKKLAGEIAGLKS